MNNQVEQIAGNVIFIGCALSTGVIVLSWLRVVIITWKLGRHLEKNNPERQTWLTGAPEWGTYNIHPFRIFSYVFSDMDIDDPTASKYKQQIKQSIMLTLVGVGLMLLMIAMVIVICFIQDANKKC